MKELDKTLIEDAFSLLGDRLADDKLGPFHLVVCGGASLIASALAQRTTKDVDIVALIDGNNHLTSPDPLPDDLLRLARDIAEDFDLEESWLNNGPSRGAGGLFQMGLPEGLAGRLIKKQYGEFLAVYLIDRIDQIFLKVYAAVDGGPGRHSADLQSLNPSDEELEEAAKWAMTHDVSDECRLMLKSMFKQLGHENVAERI